MTFLKQNKMPTIFGTAILAVSIAYGGTVFASHSFEAGVEGGNIPDNTHIRLDGLTLAPGAVFPLYDSSPNYISAHVLISAPCVEVDDDTNRPPVAVIAGHVDELNSRTLMASIPLFYINSVSNEGTDICIWHAHVPDPLNGGAPRVTDIDLINLSDDQDAVFSSGHTVDINVQQVLGSIGSAPYENGPDITGVVPNPIFDLNDDENDNDGLGHTG